MGMKWIFPLEAVGLPKQLQRDFAQECLEFWWLLLGKPSGHLRVCQPLNATGHWVIYTLLLVPPNWSKVTFFMAQGGWGCPG